ncbi:MAG TPA: cysteine--tRNA ligase [Steroidobacteraceae bacterium]
MIRIHNSLTGEKEELKPIDPPNVRMYVCGMTIYDHLHVGHARMLTAFDVVQRYLRYRGYKVTYVRNITDIDDKIIKRAAENGESIESLTERFIRAMNEDCEQLGIQKPDFEPRATQHVPHIIAMIQKLIERGYAYVASNGDVNYSVSQFEGYGRLSGKKLADLRAGARVEVDPSKRDPLDFVLWKAAKPGEPAWDSPWGPGRPGWHIECSAMSTAILGNHFDLHGGGMDLKFPHHENEIAQSCAATGEPFVNIWMHNGFVNVDNEKMSKSVGNFFTLREVFPKLRHPEVLRYFLISSHYRGPINYSPEQLEQADAALTRLYTALRDLPAAPAPTQGEHTTRFIEAMDDDFNTPEALAVLQSLTREINTARANGNERIAAVLGAELRQLAGVLGLLQVDVAEWFRRSAHGTSQEGEGALDETKINELIAARLAARKARNWAEADRIRDQLTQAGIILEDKPDGTTVWRRK